MTPDTRAIHPATDGPLADTLLNMGRFLRRGAAINEGELRRSARHAAELRAQDGGTNREALRALARDRARGHEQLARLDRDEQRQLVQRGLEVADLRRLS